MLRQVIQKLRRAPILGLLVTVVLLATACGGVATPSSHEASPEPATPSSSWETWWFWGIALLVLAGAALGGYRLGVRSIEARSRELETQVADRTKELAALNAIAQTASRSLELDAMLTGTLDEVLESLEFESGAMYLKDFKTGELQMVCHRGLSEAFRHVVAKGMISARAAESANPIIIDDLSEEPDAPKEVGEEGYRSVASIPLVSKGQVQGVLTTASRQLRRFRQQDVDLLLSIGHQIGVAIENGRLFEAEQRRAEQFRVISEVGSRITSILAVGELLEQMARLIKEAFNYYHVGFGLVEGNEVVSRAEVGPFRDAYQSERLKVGEEGIWGWVAATGEPLLVPDVSQESRYYSEFQPSDVRSVLCVPLKTKEAIIGVVSAESDQLDAFDESDLVVLRSLADQAAIAVENARLYERAQQLAVVEERQRLARELHDSVTQALYGATLYAEATARQLTSGEVELAADHLRELRDTTQEALREMRLLIFELRPLELEREGLVAVLQARLEAVETRAGLKTEFSVEGEGRLPPEIEEGLYRIAQEALNNALKHACAQSVAVSLRLDEPTVVLEIMDDGIGFDPSTALEGGGLGLDGMVERAAQLGGQLTVESKPEAGTRVRVEVPR